MPQLLSLFQNVIKENLANRDDIRYQLSLLKLVAFLVPFLCAMRRKMKIPDLSKLLPPLIGKSIRSTSPPLPHLPSARERGVRSDWHCMWLGFSSRHNDCVSGGLEFSKQSWVLVLIASSFWFNPIQSGATGNTRVNDWIIWQQIILRVDFITWI